MEPFVTRIGDVTIERVVPRANKEPRDSIPVPSVSLAKRGGDEETISDGISVSDDLQIFLKPPLHESLDKTLLDHGTRESLSNTRKRHAKLSSDDEASEDESDLEDEQSSRGGVLDNGDSESESDLRVNVNQLEQDVRSENSVQRECKVENQFNITMAGDPTTLSEGISSRDKEKEVGEVSSSQVSSEKCESNKRKADVTSNALLMKKKAKLSGKDVPDVKMEPNKSSSSSDSDDAMEGDHNKPAMERKVSNLRRNIREVMNESQLDEETLAAQRQEMERLRRVQEQQRIIREVQRQIALNRQNTKTQTRVISLLQGNSSILKQIPGTSSSSGSQVRLPNTVLVKLASSSSTAPNNAAQSNKKVFELLRVQKGTTGRGSSPVSRSSGSVRAMLGKARSAGQVHMMTPSVSIAPVMSSVRSTEPPSESESEGEQGSDKDAIARAALKKVGGKPKGKDVVTISSSSDDDDCILLSEPSSGDEADPVDDPTNSGMHTNDLYNVPDEQGRVLVNVGHPPEEEDIFLAPQIARVIKPHQIGGVRFLYDNVVETIDRFNTSTGFGCILAHSMGLGKTLQVVSFCDVFLRHTKARTVLCIMPINTLQNWLAEFNLWLPDKDTQNNPLAVHGEVRPREFPLHVLNDSHKSMTARCKVIQEWGRDGGVLLIGYELYRQLSLKRAHKTKKKRKKNLDVVDVDEEDKNKALLDEIHSALVKPGPDLVICDEGHRIKNSHASISQALKQIRSKRRVVLTGYPLQNNLLEYWCMVDFVRPNYLGTKAEFCNMFERPIQNGQCIDSTPQDIRLMRYRAHVLHSLLEGFVQRRSHSVLQVSLPQKEEYVLLLRMNAFQRKLYDTFMNDVVRTKAVPNPLKAFAVCCKIWNHPDVLYYFLKKRAGGDDVDLDIEEATGSSSSLPSSTPVPMTGSGSPRGIGTKRGRGRGSRGGQPSKREKKAFGLQAGNKPAATIVPNNTNVNSDPSNQSAPSSNVGRMGHNPHGMGGSTSQVHNQMQQPQNQGFNIMHQNQNQSYTGNQNSYHNIPYHQNAVQSSNQGYSGQGGYGGTSYTHNSNNTTFSRMDTHSYGGSNHTSGYGECGESNNQTSTYTGASGQVYYSTSNGSNQQGEYNPYYTSAPNQQQSGEGTYSCNTETTSNYWQNNSSFYQQNMHSQNNDSTNNSENQYYGNNNNGASYSNTDESSYYMNQNQSQGYSGQMNNDVYPNMNSENNFLDEMGHIHGSHNSQNPLGDSPNRINSAQTGHMGNAPTLMSNNFSDQVSSQGVNITKINNSNKISGSQNQTGNSDQLCNSQISTCHINKKNLQENSGQTASLSQMMNSENPLPNPCHVGNQSHLGNPSHYGNVNNNHPTSANHLLNTNQTSGSQNHMSNQPGNPPNQKPSSQSQVGSFNHIPNTKNQEGNSSNTVPHNLLNTPDQMMCSQDQSSDCHIPNNQNQAVNSNQIVGNQIENSSNEMISNNPVSSPNQMVSINEIGTSPNQMINQIGTSSNQTVGTNQSCDPPNQFLGNNGICTSPKQMVVENQVGNTGQMDTLHDQNINNTQMNVSLNQMVDNNKMDSPPNHIGVNNQMGTSQNQLSASPSQIGNNQMTSNNQMIGSNHTSTNQVIGNNQMITSQNQLVGNNQVITSSNQMIGSNPNQMVNNNHLSILSNQMISSNQLGTSLNQAVNNNNTNNQVVTSQNHMVDTNQIGSPPNQMVGNNQLSSSPNHQMRMSPNQVVSTSQMGTLQSQMTSSQVSGHLNQMVSTNQMGTSPNHQMIPTDQSRASPRQMISSNLMGSSQIQMVATNQAGNAPNQMAGNNQIVGGSNNNNNNQMVTSPNHTIGNTHMGTSPNQMVGNNQIGSLQSQMINNNQVNTMSNQMGVNSHVGSSLNQMVGSNHTGSLSTQLIVSSQMSTQSSHMVSNNQISNSPSKMVGSNQVSTSSNQMVGNDQTGTPTNHMISNDQTNSSQNIMASNNQIGTTSNQMVSSNHLNNSPNQIMNTNQMNITSNHSSTSPNQIMTTNPMGISSNHSSTSPNQIISTNRMNISSNHSSTSPNEIMSSNHMNISSNHSSTSPNQIISSNLMSISSDHSSTSPNQIMSISSNHSSTSPNQIMSTNPMSISSVHSSTSPNEIMSTNPMNISSVHSSTSPNEIMSTNHMGISSIHSSTSSNQIMSTNPMSISSNHSSTSPNQIMTTTQMNTSPNHFRTSPNQIMSTNQMNTSPNQMNNSSTQIVCQNQILITQNHVLNPDHSVSSQSQMVPMNQMNTNQIVNAGSQGSSHSDNSQNNFSDLNPLMSQNQICNPAIQPSNTESMVALQNDLNQSNRVDGRDFSDPNQGVNSEGQLMKSGLATHSYNQVTSPMQKTTSQNQGGCPNELPGAQNIDNAAIHPDAQSQVRGSHQVPNCTNQINYKQTSEPQNQVSNVTQVANSQNLRNNVDNDISSQNQLSNANQITNLQNLVNNTNQISDVHSQVNCSNQNTSQQNLVTNSTQLTNTLSQVGDLNQLNSEVQIGSFNQLTNCNDQMNNFSEMVSSHTQCNSDHIGESQNQLSDLNQSCSSESQTINQIISPNTVGNSSQRNLPSERCGLPMVTNSDSHKSNNQNLISGLHNQLSNHSQSQITITAVASKHNKINSQNEQCEQTNLENHVNSNETCINSLRNQINNSNQRSSSQMERCEHELVLSSQNHDNNLNSSCNLQISMTDHSQTDNSHQTICSQSQITKSNVQGNNKNQGSNSHQHIDDCSRFIDSYCSTSDVNQDANSQNQMNNSHIVNSHDTLTNSSPVSQNQVGNCNHVSNSQGQINDRQNSTTQNQMTDSSQVTGFHNQINVHQNSEKQSQVGNKNQTSFSQIANPSNNFNSSVPSISSCSQNQTLGSNKVRESDNQLSSTIETQNNPHNVNNQCELTSSGNQIVNQTVNFHGQLGNSNHMAHLQTPIDGVGQMESVHSHCSSLNQIISPQHQVSNPNQTGNFQNQACSSNSVTIPSSHSDHTNPVDTCSQVNCVTNSKTQDEVPNGSDKLEERVDVASEIMRCEKDSGLSTTLDVDPKSSLIGNIDQVMSSNAKKSSSCSDQSTRNQIMNTQKLGLNCSQVSNAQEQDDMNDLHARIQDIHNTAMNNFSSPLMNISNSIGSETNTLVISQNQVTSPNVVGKLDSMGISFSCQTETAQNSGPTSGQHTPYLGQFVHPGIQGNGSHTSTTYSAVNQSFSGGEVKLESESNPCDNSIHNMGAMYAHFSGEDLQGRMHPWGSENYASESKLPLKQEGIEIKKDEDSKQLGKTGLQTNPFSTEAAQQFDSKSPFKVNPYTENIAMKVEKSDKCDSKNSVSHESLLSCKSTNCVNSCSETSPNSNKAELNSGDPTTQSCVNVEGSNFKENTSFVSSNSSVPPPGTSSPKSESKSIGNDQRDMSLRDSKCVETECSLNKSVSIGTDANGDDCKDVGCGTASDNFRAGPDKQFADLGTNTSRAYIKEELGIPYDWATELLKDYIPGNMENSAKMVVFFCILEESMALGDRILVFSQSLFTLNLIEDFLQRTNLPGRQEKWARNWNYYRLDGSTSALEREKLINEYNSNPNIHLFLVSTRAGSLGINLVGANRVVVFDASWNPCHDTQAVCRVYRYGQKKPCFVYRLVMDNCLEKKIYDRQINKQGMADRVVDECNPDAHLSIKEVTNLCWDNEEESEVRDFSKEKDKYIDVVMQKVLDKYSTLLSKEPFQHESLLVDRKEKKLSQAEKRLAKRSYELEKQANINYNRPQYTYYPSPGVGNSGVQTSLQIRAIRTDGAGGNVMPKPVASVRPMQAELNSQIERGPRSTVSTVNTGRSRWIPADVWQRQGMSAQEMTLPLDVVIPTNSPDRASIVLKAGQRVMVLKSPKGIYMQLENGKIIAIRTAFKVGGAGKGAAAQDYKATAALNADKADMESKLADIKKEANILPPSRCNTKISSVLPLKNNSAITITPKNNPVPNLSRPVPGMTKVMRTPVSGVKHDLNMKPWGSHGGGLGRSRSFSGKVMHQPTAEAKPYFHHQNQMGRLSSECYRVGSGMGSQPTAMAKPYFHHEGESREPRSSHSSLSDDTSSGAENMATSSLLHDEKENSSLGDNDMLLKSPIPSPDYTAIVHRREDAEHDSGLSYEDLPHHPHGMEESRFPTKNSSFHQEASNWQSSREQMIDGRNFRGINVHTDEKVLRGSAMGERNFQVFPEKRLNADHRNFQMTEFGRGHEISREQQMEHSGCNTVCCPDGSREGSRQDVKRAPSYMSKDAVSSGPSDKGSQKLYQSFSNTQTQAMNDRNLKLNEAVRNPEKNSMSSVGCSVKSHSFSDQLKSPGNFQVNLDSAPNTFINYDRAHGNSGHASDSVPLQNKTQQHKNMIRNYSDSAASHNSMDEYGGESKSKCDGSGDSHYEFETGRNSGEIDLNTMSNQPPLSQSYHSSLSGQAPSNPQMSPNPMTSSKKGRPVKLPTSNEYSGRFDGDHQHMKSFQRTNSSNSQNLDQANPPSSARNFGQNINIAHENSQIEQSKTHVSGYQPVDNSKNSGQQTSEHSQYSGSSYGQYIGGPGSNYYGFSQQGSGAMSQFGNSYYGENQYDRSADSHEQSHQSTPEKSLPQNVGRSQNQQASSSLSHKKDSTQMNSESKEPKQDSKPSPVSVREDGRNVASPGSTSGSRSGNNSARSTPAGINQTVSSAESSVNYTAPLSSVASNSASSNFSPYPPGNNSTSGNLPAHQNPYESMMLNSYSPGNCQYNIPGSNTPGTSNPFSPPATNYGNPLRPTGTGNAVPPYGAPSSYGNSMGYNASAPNQYDSDYARASMYSAFHRPEPHHFGPGPAELGSPFLASMAPPTNPAPFGLTPHRSPHFPSSSSPTAQNPNYYAQNMYAPSPYTARPGYAGPDPAYGVPYGAPGASGFNPFLNHHLHQHPYPSLQHPGPSAPASSQSSNSSPPQ